MPWRLQVVRSAEGTAPADAAGYWTARLEVAGSLEVAEVGAVLASLSELVAEQAVTVLTCDARGLVREDLGTVDALARLQVAARRLGCPLVLCGVSHDLRGLIALLGLAKYLPEIGHGSDL